MSAAASWVVICFGNLAALVVLGDLIEEDGCDWPRVDGSTISSADFERLYFEKKAVLITNLMNDWPAVTEKRWSEENILSKYGDLPVNTSHIATNCRGLWEFKSGILMSEYLAYDGPASWFMQPWHPMAQDMAAQKDFMRPKLLSTVSNEGPALSIGRRGQGNIFHNHDHNWLAQVSGKKRWLVVPPKSRPEPAQMSARSDEGPCAPRPKWKDLSGCVATPGDIVYVPSSWWHETCYYTDFSIGVAYVGSSVSKSVGDGSMNIWQAAIEGDLASLKAAPASSVGAASALGELPLNLAARHGHAEAARWLIGSRAAVNAVQKRGGERALHIAATNGHVDVVKVLVENRAALQGVDQSKRGILHNVALRGHAAILQYLLDDVLARGKDYSKLPPAAKTQDANGMQPLHIAAGSGHVDCVEFLLSRRASAQDTDKTRNKAIHHSSYNGHANVVEALLNRRADPHEHNSGGMQVAAAAADAKLGSDRVLRVLLAARADLSSGENANGQTPLHVSAQSGHVAAVRTLVALRANVQATAQGGVSPAHMAGFGGHVAVMEHLGKGKADLNAKSDDGWRPIHAATQGGHAALVGALLQLRASPSAKGPGGNTALQMAKQVGHKAVVQLLSKAARSKSGSEL